MHRPATSLGTSLHPSFRRAALLATLCLTLLADLTWAQVVLDTTTWVPNHFVRTIRRSGNTVYLGGQFTDIGPPTGSGVELQDPSGTRVSGFPKVLGKVSAVAPDGAGGWYIGGEFTAVNGIPRSRAAHIRADRTVSAWNPNVGGLRVNTIVVWGSQVFLGGAFSSAGGQTRNSVAAVNRNSGLATAWNPSASAGSEINTIAIGQNTVYVGGRFSSIGGQARSNIAELDTVTGTATGWNPGASQDVRGVLRSGTVVYAWGDFTQLGGQPRGYLGAVSAGTGVTTAWWPRQTGAVRAVVTRNGTVYIGGEFTDFFSGALRNYIAAVDSVTGAVRTWNPNAGAGPFNGTRIQALAFHGSRLLAGGSFKTIGGQSRTCIAALDTATGLATAWDPHAGGEVYAIASNGTSVFAGGTFTSMNGVTRNRIAALDATTGVPTAWDPNAGGTVWHIRTRDGVVFAAGEFSSIGGPGGTGTQVAALDSVTGLRTPGYAGSSFTPANYLYGMEPIGTRLFLGGDVTLSLGNGAVTRTDLGAIDRWTGAGVASWDPRPVDAAGNLNMVNAMSLRDSRLFVGGRFGYIGGLYRKSLTAVDTLTGQSDYLWDPNPNSDVLALTATPDRIYVGGQFTSIGGQSRNWLAALDPVTAQATSWAPSVDGSVAQICQGAGLVCIRGDFTTVDGNPRAGIAALDNASGAVLDWTPSLDGGSVFALEVQGKTIYVGGQFVELEGQPLAYFGLYRFPPSTAGVPAPTPVATNSLRAWPNPFVGDLSIAFDLPAEQDVRVEVIDAGGRKVWGSPATRLSAGPQRVTWNGKAEVASESRLASGIYFLRVVGETFVSTRRIVRL